jgi:carbonic anhydrase/acetyltransferase-like protein (isoleucine patch superfamily)
MDFSNIKTPASHGKGEINIADFKHFGNGIVMEEGVLVFHPDTITLNDKVYVGHNTILKGYYKGEMHIGEGTWIGQNCFFHSAGGIFIGKAVGIGPGVKILTSFHTDINPEIPVMHNPLEFGRVEIMDGADIGVGTIILPNVTIGEGAIVGAGSVVTRSVEAYSVYAGSPARLLRKREMP